MREGNPAAGQAAPGRPARRLRLASPATALVLGCVILALVAVEWPFAGLAHLGVNSSTLLLTPALRAGRNLPSQTATVDESEQNRGFDHESAR
jgi:hypothetical protein